MGQEEQDDRVGQGFGFLRIMGSVLFLPTAGFLDPSS